MTGMGMGDIFGMVGGAFNFVTGAYQYVKGTKALKNLERPEYRRPSEIDGNVQIAEQIMYEGLPAASKQAYNRQVQRQQAAMLASQGSLNAQLSGLAASNVAAMDATSRLYIEDANARLRGKETLMQANRELAQYKDREFAYDYQDYLEDRDFAYALIGSGMQNMASGLDYAGSGASGTQFNTQQRRDEVDVEPMQSRSVVDDLRDESDSRTIRQSPTIEDMREMENMRLMNSLEPYDIYG